MKTFFSKLVFFLVVVSIFAYCNKNLGGNPAIEFFTDNEYTWKNDSIAPGDTILIGLKCTWNSKDPLVNINVFRNDVPQDPIEISSNDSEGVGYGLKFEKSAAEKDSMVFELNDSQGQMASISLVLFKDTSQSDLKELNAIVLGAQTSTDNPLYSISSFKSYSLTEANEDEPTQKVIDLVGAFDSDNNMFIASPATNFNGIYDFSTWTETNTTKFVEAVNYTDDIYGILNKTKIKKTFDDAGESGQKKKAKDLSQGDMFVFKTQSGKYGVLKVNSTTDGESGSIDFDLKIQR